MLTHLELENFKSFADLKNFGLSPITVLCGTNSSGKSTILQSLLLAKQSFESQGNDQIALLNGKLVHLGNLGNIIYSNDPKRTLKISQTFDLSNDEIRMLRNMRQVRLPLPLIFRELLGGNQEIYDNKRYIFQFDVGLKNTDVGNTPTQQPKAYVDSLDFSLKVLTKEEAWVSGPRVSMRYKSGSKYDLSWSNVRSRPHSNMEILPEGSTECHAVFANLLPLGIRTVEEVESEKRPSFDPYFFTRIRDLLKVLTTNYSYIGPLREEPARRYIYEDEVLEIGVKGENAAFVYLKEKASPIHGSYMLDDSQENFVETGKITLEDAVRKWFSFLGIDDFQTETQNELIQLTHRAPCTTPTRVNIADSGFGISQIFPIIVEGLRIPLGKTLILEQPEIHLHPRMQMQRKRTTWT